MELPKVKYFVEMLLFRRNYTRLCKNDKTLCAICMMDECNEENDRIWDRYELRCGHKMHKRCFIKWTNESFTVKCPYCGVNESNSDIYCSKCDVFGHDCLRTCKICCTKGHDCVDNESYKTLVLHHKKTFQNIFKQFENEKIVIYH